MLFPMYRQAARVVAAIGLAMTIGCAADRRDVEPTYPVSGTVTFDGEPVEGAQVVFVAVGEGLGAVGTTDSSGRYSLTTFQAGDGALPGEYQVRITQFAGAVAENPGSDSDEDYVDPGRDDAWVPENLLPAHYADPGTSGLTATVTEGDNSRINFVLTE